MEQKSIAAPQGKLGVLVVGLGGAVSTTFIIGCLAARRGLARPVGSVTQLSLLELPDGEQPLRDVVPLAGLNQLVFGGWDIFPDSVLDGARHAAVLTDRDVDLVADEAAAIRPMRAVFDPRYITRLNGTWLKTVTSPWDAVEQLRRDIREFRQREQVERVVVVWSASTEVYVPAGEIHQDLTRFEQAMRDGDADVSPSMCYAYAAIAEGCAFVNGAPALTVDFPAMQQLAERHRVPIAGKDYKTGQTMMKTVLAPALHARMLGLRGWFSTNILGNRDGEVLDDPASFRTKEVSKLSVLDSILEPEKYPELYADAFHKVRINYYPPRGDSKESWDNIDIVGWMDYPMQIKVNFLCRDSILAAPVLLDLVLLMDLSQRCGWTGTQRWLSFYFKSPMHDEGETPIHDLFEQNRRMRDVLCRVATAWAGRG